MILTFAFALSWNCYVTSFFNVIFSNRDIKTLESTSLVLCVFFNRICINIFYSSNWDRFIIFGFNSVINQSGNNISNILPSNIAPNEIECFVPHIDKCYRRIFSIIFWFIINLWNCSSSINKYDLLKLKCNIYKRYFKKFFVKNMNNKNKFFLLELFDVYIYFFINFINTKFKSF